MQLELKPLKDYLDHSAVWSGVQRILDLNPLRGAGLTDEKAQELVREAIKTVVQKHAFQKIETQFFVGIGVVMDNHKLEHGQQPEPGDLLEAWREPLEEAIETLYGGDVEKFMGASWTGVTIIGPDMSEPNAVVRLAGSTAMDVARRLVQHTELAELGYSETTINDIAERFKMSTPAVVDLATAVIPVRQWVDDLKTKGQVVDVISLKQWVDCAVDTDAVMSANARATMGLSDDAAAVLRAAAGQHGVAAIAEQVMNPSAPAATPDPMAAFSFGPAAAETPAVGVPTTIGSHTAFVDGQKLSLDPMAAFSFGPAAGNAPTSAPEQPKQPLGDPNFVAALALIRAHSARTDEAVSKVLGISRPMVKKIADGKSDFDPSQHQITALRTLVDEDGEGLDQASNLLSGLIV